MAEEADRAEKAAEEKSAVLREANLFEKEYSDSAEFSLEYPLYDLEKGCYYRAKSLDLSDEEWEAVKAAHERENALQKKTAEPLSETRVYVDNGVANTLKAIAIIIYVIGALGGIIIGAVIESFLVTHAVWFGVFIAGTMMLGFAEIVKLLGRIDSNVDLL